jgi:hypothetical protein
LQKKIETLLLPARAARLRQPMSFILPVDCANVGVPLVPVEAIEK